MQELSLQDADLLPAREALSRGDNVAVIDVTNFAIADSEDHAVAVAIQDIHVDQD